MLLVMPRPQMLLSLRYTSVVSLFGLLSALNLCRHYLELFFLKKLFMLCDFGLVDNIVNQIADIARSAMEARNFF